MNVRNSYYCILYFIVFCGTICHVNYEKERPEISSFHTDASVTVTGKLLTRASTAVTRVLETKISNVLF